MKKIECFDREYTDSKTVIKSTSKNDNLSMEIEPDGSLEISIERDIGHGSVEKYIYLDPKDTEELFDLFMRNYIKYGKIGKDKK